MNRLLSYLRRKSPTFRLWFPEDHTHSWKRTKSGKSFYCTICDRIIWEGYL